MTSAAAGRPAHGARSTVGGGLADWLIGGGILALLVAAFGVWGLPLLFPPGPVTAERTAPPPVPLAPLVDEGPLPVLPGIEAPLAPAATTTTGATPPPPARAAEALRREVAELINSDAGADAPAIEATQAEAFVGADQLITLPSPPVGERISVAALAQRLGNDPQAEVTVRRQVVAVQPRRLVDLLQQAVVDDAAPAAPRPLQHIAQELQRSAAMPTTRRPSPA